MRELTKSFFSFTLASSLFGLKQMENLFTPRERGDENGPVGRAFEEVTDAYTQQFGETLSSVFRTLDNTQRGMVSLMFSFLGEGVAHRNKWERRRDRERDPAEPRVVTDLNWRSETARAPLTYDDLKTGTY